jgi:hypothetical protein
MQVYESMDESAKNHEDDDWEGTQERRPSQKEANKRKKKKPRPKAPVSGVL